MLLIYLLPSDSQLNNLFLFPLGFQNFTSSISPTHQWKNKKAMEEDMGSEEETHLTRKRSSSCRRASSSEGHSNAINVADARREIAAAYALKLHGSSSSLCVTEKEPIVTGNSSNHEINSDAQYCYSLLEAMPLPEPVWSTTAPAVLAEPPSAPPIEDSVGFEWGESQASYTWWLGFLKSLDCNMNITDKLNYPFVENVVMENSKVLSHDSTFVDAVDHSCCPDDWLMIPTIEMDLGDVFKP